MYYRQYEILHVPMKCIVCGVVVFLREFWLWRGGVVGRWLATMSKKKEKMPPRKSMGKGVNVPGNLEKSHGPPQKTFERNKWELSIHLLLMFPVCYQTSLCL